MKDATYIVATANADGGQADFYPVKGQIMAGPNGETAEVEHLLTVLRDTSKSWPPGTVLATDSLALRPDTCWVVGNRVQQVTDENGKYVTPADDDQRETIEQYKIFMAGDVQPKKANKGKTVLEKLREDSRMTPPTVEDDGFYVDEELFYFLLISALDREPLLLIGDTGTGKTELCQLMADRLKISCEIFDMAISNPTASLCGSLRINPAGYTEYELARFARELQNPGLKVLDELTRAAPSANNVLLSVTDSRRTLYVEGNLTQPQIKMHEKAYIWATANMGVQFIGTSALDSALANRFTPVGISAPPQDAMIKVLMKRSDMDYAEAMRQTDFVERVNSAQNLSKGVSPRQQLKMGKLQKAGFTLTQAVERIVLPQYEKDEQGGEYGIVATLIQSL